MAVLSDASVLSGFVAGYAFVKEKQIICSHSVSIKLPKVVGLGIGFSSAEEFLRWFTLFNHYDILRDFNIFRRIWKKDIQ